jgi:hypothetical protein
MLETFLAAVENTIELLELVLIVVGGVINDVVR